jgi:hypothetical protein
MVDREKNEENGETIIVVKIDDNTNNYVPNILGVDIAVDKLSNSMRNNFLIISVDKRYTLVVYLSTR